MGWKGSVMVRYAFGTKSPWVYFITPETKECPFAQKMDVPVC